MVYDAIEYSQAIVDLTWFDFSDFRRSIECELALRRSSLVPGLRFYMYTDRKT